VEALEYDCPLGQELHNSCWIVVTCLEWEVLHCISYSLVVLPSLLVVILDCTYVLLLRGIIGQTEICEVVSSWNPICKILLNDSYMPRDLVVGLGSSKILHKLDSPPN